MKTREQVVNNALSYLGIVKGSALHKKIIDIYNTQNPLPIGYKMTTSAPWCATFVSANAIQCGVDSIYPLECSCGRMIELLKKKGQWVENDAYVPKVADLIFYDWDDNGVGDCTGAPDHVGLVEKVVNNTIYVIEGNMGTKSQVGRRSLKVNARYIRGFGAIQFPEVVVEKVSVSLPIIQKGSKGEEVKALQTLLNLRGNKLSVDGSCGDLTTNAIKKFQKEKKLSIDGICGKDTWSALIGG